MTTVISQHQDRRELARWTLFVFLVGLGLSMLLWLRSQVAGDQLNMLARGWLLIAEGQWISFGLPTSAGGKAPGGFTGVLVGLPLLIWQHHRAPTLIILAGNLVAYLLLDRVLAREMGAKARLLFAVFYWLNPWRLYHASFLWNPNYLLPLGALHFWTVYRQRVRPRFWESFLQIVTIGLAAQVHASVVTLVVLSLLLWWKGYFRFHWAAVALAIVVVTASLLPWALTVLQDPSLLPQATPQNGRLAQTAVSLSRGLGYWIRYPALIASSTILCLDFGFLPSAWTGDPIRHLIQGTVGLFTLPIVLWANSRLWRGATGWWQRFANFDSFRQWLVGVIRWSLLGTLAACALTPTAVMSWQLLTVLHLTVIPLVLLSMDLIGKGRLPVVRAGVVTYAAVSILLVIAIGVGSPMYRCGGATCGAMNADPPPLRADHEMLDELAIHQTCLYEVNVPGGWWPDVLPEH